MLFLKFDISLENLIYFRMQVPAYWFSLAVVELKSKSKSTVKSTILLLLYICTFHGEYFLPLLQYIWRQEVLLSTLLRFKIRVKVFLSCGSNTVVFTVTSLCQ